ncbi:MAG: hypothetical protein RLN72_10555 [Henriciella sp.]
MAQLGFNAARKRYNRLYWPAIAVYVAVCIGAAIVLDKETSPQWMLSGAAILTAIPLVFIMWLMLRHQDETDEYTRMRQLKAFARGSCITISAIWVVGSFQLWELVPGVNVFWFGPFFFFAYGLSYCWSGLFGKTV